MDNSILDDYSELVKLELTINGMRSKYPFTINERATYTQHELELYKQNYCNEKSGGGKTDIVMIRM